MSTLLCCLEMCGDMSGGHDDDDERGIYVCVCVCLRISFSGGWAIKSFPHPIPWDSPTQ